MKSHLQSLWGKLTSTTNGRTIGLIAILILIAAVPLTVFIAQQQQEIRQRASYDLPDEPTEGNDNDGADNTPQGGDDDDKDSGGDRTCGGKTGKGDSCKCSKASQCTSNVCEKRNTTDKKKVCIGPTPTVTPTGGVTATPTPILDCSSSNNKQSGCSCGNNSECRAGVCDENPGGRQKVCQGNPSYCDVGSNKPGGCACRRDNQCASSDCRRNRCTGPTPTPSPTPTSTPTVTPTRTPTPTVTGGVTGSPTPPLTGSPTPTGGNGTASLEFTLALQGVSDRLANRRGPSPVPPTHNTREIMVKVFNVDNGQKVADVKGTVALNSTNNTFTGSVPISNVTAGRYDIQIKIDKYLSRRFQSQTLAGSGTYRVPEKILVAGDINNDNFIDILDYNLVAFVCFGSKGQRDPSCNAADVTDDGKTDIDDVNYVFSNIASREGE